MKSVTLPKGTVLNINDKINFFDNTFKKDTGTIAAFKDVGELGWMSVLRGSSYEWVSIKNMVDQIGEKNILVKKS